MDVQMNEYIQLIQKAFTSTNNEERKNAEQTLIADCCQKSNGMEILINIILNPQQTDFLRESAALLTCTIVKRLLTLPTPYEGSLQALHAEAFVRCLQSPSLNYKLKGYVATSLANLQNFSARGYDNKASQRLILQKHCQQLIDSQDLAQVEGGLFIFQSLLTSLEVLNTTIEVPQPQFEWVQSFLQKGKDIVLALTKAQQNDVQQLQSQSKQFYSKIEPVQALVIPGHRYMGLNKDQMISLQNFMIQSEGFSVSLLQVLTFLASPHNQTIISQTGDQPIDSLINEAKGNALNSMNMVLSMLMNDRSKHEAKRSPFYAQLTQLLPTIIICLVAYTSSPIFDINEIVRQVHLSNLITQLLNFITLCGAQSEFYNVLSESKTCLLVDVLLPIIATSKQEAAMMIEEPEEFVNLALDTIDKQSSEVPKTAAAALLEVFCDHIDGCTSFISQFCNLIISHAIKQIKEKSDGTVTDPTSPFILLKDLSNRLFFTKISPVQRIDASLVTLTVMSYLLSRRSDLIMLLEQLLKENCMFFSDPHVDPLITVRLSLFLGYYCDNLFKADVSNQSLQSYIQLLIGQLANTNQPWSQAVMYQSVDALKNIFEDEDLVPKVSFLVPWLFPQLCLSLTNSCYEQHFDMIMSLIKMYAKQIGGDVNLLKVVLDVLVKRITTDQINVQHGKKESQLWINKSWNILRILPEVEGYLPQHLELIESYLIPMFSMLEQPELVEFDEDIFLIVSAMIEKTKVVTEAQKKLLFLVPAVLVKQKNTLGQIFEMLNNYIVYGSETFQNLQLQNLLFQVALQAMVSKGEVSNEADEGEGVLLIQLAIQRLNSIIHNDVLKLVFQTILQRSSLNVQQNFLKSRFLGVFLSSFMYDFGRTKTLLQELGLLDQIFLQIVENSFLCEPGYDIKLYVYSMCSIIQNTPQVFSVRLIDNLVTLLFRQQHHENKKQSKVKDGPDDFDESSEEFMDDDSEDLFNEEKQEAQMTMETFKSEVKDKDEYEMFKTTILYLKQNLPECINQLKNELTSEKLQFLQNMLNYTRVISGGVLGAPRKIVKISKRKVQ